MKLNNGSLTLEYIKKNPDKMQRFINVRIWSNEHKAWWRNNCCGYTDIRHIAGVFTIDMAFSQTKHCCRKKRIVFEPTKLKVNSEVHDD